MKLADMKRTKAEKKEADERFDKPYSPGSEDYHHGLHIELDHDGMEKLGMHETPKPGTEVRGEFKGRVTHSSEDADEHGKPRRSARILLHHIGVDADGDDDGDKRSAKDDLKDELAKSRK